MDTVGIEPTTVSIREHSRECPCEREIIPLDHVPGTDKSSYDVM